jgi:hypothetical protein
MNEIQKHMDNALKQVFESPEDRAEQADRAERLRDADRENQEEEQEEFIRNLMDDEGKENEK